MSGSLGMGGNLNKWAPEDMEAAAQFVAFYKRVRATVQRGGLYRLIAPESSEVSATEYVSQDRSQAVLFAFLHSQQFGTPFPTVHLRGLDANAMYKVGAIDPKQLTSTESVSGAYLMHQASTSTCTVITTVLRSFSKSSPELGIGLLAFSFPKEPLNQSSRLIFRLARATDGGPRPSLLRT